jgi:NitT/TauT family transport system substrate-binding protein
LSGNLLVVGSVANIIVVDAASRRGIAIGWRDHARIGIPVTLAIAGGLAGAALGGYTVNAPAAILQTGNAIPGRSPTSSRCSEGRADNRSQLEERCLRRNALRVTLGALALIGLCHWASAVERVALMVAGVEKQIYIPVKLAKQLGYFAEQGLEVELLSEPSGVHAEDMLLAGAVQGVVGFYDHTIELQARGKAVVSVVQLGLAPGEVELVSSRMAAQIKSPGDFRGHTLGVTDLRSSTHVLTQYLAIAHGVKLNEINVLPVGSGDQFITAMNDGTIDAGMSTEPTVSRMLKSGEARILVDLRSPESTVNALGGPYPAACLYMNTAWVDHHRKVVQKLADALRSALRYIQTHSAEEIAGHVPAEYYAGDRELYVQALAVSKAAFTPDGRMPALGPVTVLKVLSAVDKSVHGKDINLSQTYTSEFVPATRPGSP